MQEKEIIERIFELCQSREWSIYRLAKESNITYSTLCTMLHNENMPSLPTLIKLCSGFGITLSEFFDDGNEFALLTDEQKNYLQWWERLNAENKVMARKYIEYLISQQ